MLHLTALGWCLLALTAFVGGFSKTALSGAATAAVVLAALVLPAKESTALLLVMLLAGDAWAIRTYWRDADWRLLVRLILPVVVGVAAGGVFLGRVDDHLLRRTIGAILLVLLVVGLLTRHHRPGRVEGQLYGGLAGFTTMVANAGGPAMSLYLLGARYGKLAFLGTTAWFFATVNLVLKLPVMISLGMMTRPVVLTGLALVPVVWLGAWVGRLVVARLDDMWFARLVTAFVVVSAFYLVLA
ncbi:sulfite exporter TauE/SafE family protein [Raineyella fluvialis]|uniref:Probable membrane transporter protein n=1 Tax=Raineyella fluvialis TaxID=2662261 RepID=A0A5Q2FD32_9ACTN|nr:sulfite exporter TauE/SafE family protein [Raineyella fluvialis]QGF22993.1 TSUP family transporter [Raineyella fluvialis]